MENMDLYSRFKDVPEEARKPIEAGRLKGFTDINPMWRIKMLTEAFGPCGVGWIAKPIDMRTVQDNGKGEVALFIDIELTYKIPGTETWSQPIFGTGGSKLLSMERNGLYFDDEAYKKAYTDAISVACKALGIGADVYWNCDSDKYIDPKKDNAIQSSANTKTSSDPHADMKKVIINLAKKIGLDENELRTKAESYIELRDGVFTSFDEMNAEQLSAVKLKVATMPRSN